ncbi:MAG: glycoside hydrolase family 13 protein [Propionibacteriales bacterium]|nr:glycoside hydrolase family 13 protein [Propionibacteriales bacterium]
MHTPWWRDAVCYQIYVRSFADSTGDGLGDLPGVTSRLPYLRDLGVDAIWLTPFYTSPQHDHGYDVADYRDVDPRFGTLDDFGGLIATAHRLGLKVIVDLVPNHTSYEHPWFKAAYTAAPGSRERKRYIVRPGRGREGVEPPNNWQSVFGGPAWTRLPDGQWYLHLFDTSQPDLNWRNREVRDEFEAILRFWLDRGVDGFRIDVAHGLVKAKDLPDGPGRTSALVTPYWDQPEVHTIYRRWHRVLADYDGDRMAIAEAWAADEAKMARYLRPDELQQAFNFHWLEAPWSAAAFRRVIARTYAAVDPVGASPTWVLSNHDVTREVTRYGGGAVGVARSRAATLAMLALPGSAYIYQGTELGLPEVEVPEKHREDPTWLRGGGVGRDGCRVPIPWSGSTRPYGFGPADSKPWLPQPAEWRKLSVEAQDGAPASTLTFFRRALTVRRQTVAGLDDAVHLPSAPPGVLVIERASGFSCVVNCGKRAVRLSRLAAATEGAGHRLGDVLISSGSDALVADDVLPPDTAAWFRRPVSS